MGTSFFCRLVDLFWCRPVLQALQRLDSRQNGIAAEKATLNRSEEAANDLQKVLKELTSKRDSQSFAGKFPRTLNSFSFRHAGTPFLSS